jgi:hypothetical protein
MIAMIAMTGIVTITAITMAGTSITMTGTGKTKAS